MGFLVVNVLYRVVLRIYNNNDRIPMILQPKYLAMMTCHGQAHTFVDLTCKF